MLGLTLPRLLSALALGKRQRQNQSAGKLSARTRYNIGCKRVKGLHAGQTIKSVQIGEQILEYTQAFGAENPSNDANSSWLRLTYMHSWMAPLALEPAMRLDHK